MNLPITIDQVIEQLDQIIAHEVSIESPLAYFATLYREVTINVKEGIGKGQFEDGPRMEKLDVVFASRYLHAYHQFRNGQTPTRSWVVAFEAAQEKDKIILQHLLLGINAHIDLDLGIAAATISPGQQLSDLKDDFETINIILYQLIPVVQKRLDKVSPMIGWFDRLGGMRDEQLAHFGLGLSRDHAWRLACLLAPLPPDNWSPIIEVTDKATAALGKLLAYPPAWISKGLIWLIRKFESKDVAKNVAALKIEASTDSSLIAEK